MNIQKKLLQLTKNMKEVSEYVKIKKQQMTENEDINQR